MYKIGSPERKDRNSEQAITMANVEKVAATNPLIATVTRICVPWRCHFNDNIGLVNPELKNRRRTHGKHPLVHIAIYHCSSEVED